MAYKVISVPVTYKSTFKGYQSMYISNLEYAINQMEQHGWTFQSMTSEVVSETNIGYTTVFYTVVLKK